MMLKVTILGCGTSGGVPRIGNIWGACDPNNPRNRRRRCSLLVQRAEGTATTTVLVDSSPDIREQLLDVGTRWLDGVLYTHDHADHVHGIDDLRMVAYNGHRKVEAFYDAVTGQILRQRFDYCFEPPPGSEYPAILNGHEIKAGELVRIEGAGGVIDALPFRQLHGQIETLGFRFGNIAYSPDVSDFPKRRSSICKASMCGSSTRCATRRIRAIFPSRRPCHGSRGSSPNARCSPTCMST